jgi:hypothetical protein
VPLRIVLRQSPDWRKFAQPYFALRATMKDIEELCSHVDAHDARRAPLTARA